MSNKFQCYTLFDITKTGISNRSRPADDVIDENWVKKRNMQCNFDTILQAISLRSQPENVSVSEKILLNQQIMGNFGFLYGEIDHQTYCWKFEFEVQHDGVFQNEENQFGLLYRDVDEIPMIICGTEIPNLLNYLDTTPEMKNIYFNKVEGG